MTLAELGKTLRKYWYLVLLAAVFLAAGSYIASNSDRSPEELLREYGYFIILIWTFLEGETIVIIAGALSGKVGLDPWLIALCAFCGSFASDQVMFSLGKYKGEAVLSYFPRIAKNVDKAAGLFKKYDTALILGFRFVYGVRNVTPILLGISGVSHMKFFVLNAIGASIWALTFTFGGLFLGQAFMKAMEHIGHGIFYIIVAAIIGGGLIWYFRAHHNVKHAKTVVAKTPDTEGDAATSEEQSPMESQPESQPENLPENLPESQTEKPRGEE